MTSLSVFALSSTTVSAEGESYSETYTKSALIRVQSACTLSGIASTPHTDSIAPGKYKSNIGETVFSAVCNDSGGFAVYAIGYTNDTDGNNTLVNSSDSSLTIATGTADSGNTSNWAMKLTAMENAATPTILNDYDDYNVVPDDYVKVASYPSTTTASASSMFKSAYAAYISLTQPAGTYEGKVKYVMVHPSTGDAPKKKAPEPYPVDPCIANPDCDATSGVTLQRAYEMAYTAAHKGMYEETTPGSNIYQYIDSWNDVAYQGQGREVRFLIQDMTPEICATATAINSQALVLDIRDQSSYYIVKAADGRCWMQDNLALDAVANKANLSPTNTNATQAAIDNFKNGSDTAPQTGWSTGAVSYETSSSVYNQPRINVESISTVPQGSSDPLKDLANTEQWKVGVYYNYCAASIGTYCYASDQGVDKNPNSAIDADQDICPAGWRMPTGGPIGTASTTTEGGGEYQTLANAYPSISGGDNQYTRVRKALRLPLSGIFHRGSVSNQGSSGSFWSSTYYESYYMCLLYVGTGMSGIDPQDFDVRYYGRSIRCIAKTGTEQ